MDAEHRHELKTNELADWVAHFPDFCRRNATTIIGVVLIAAAILVFVYGRKIRSQGRLEQQAQAVSLIEAYDLSKLQTLGSQQQSTDPGDAIMIAANRLETAVNESKAPHVSALLLIKHAEALRTDLHYRAADVDVDMRDERIKEARQAYEKALTLAEGNPTLVAMARFGLGLCAEEVNDYIKAEEIYNGIAADADFAATVFPAQARQRLANLQDNRVQYEFAAAAPAPEQPAAPPVSAKPATPGSAEEVTIGAQNGSQTPPAEVKPKAPAADEASSATTPDAKPAAENASTATEKPAAAPDTNS